MAEAGYSIRPGAGCGVGDAEGTETSCEEQPAARSENKKVPVMQNMRENMAVLLFCFKAAPGGFDIYSLPFCCRYQSFSRQVLVLLSGTWPFITRSTASFSGIFTGVKNSSSSRCISHGVRFWAR